MIVIQLWYKLESKLTILGPFVGLEDILFEGCLMSHGVEREFRYLCSVSPQGLKLCGWSFIHLYVNMGTWKAFIYCLKLDVCILWLNGHKLASFDPCFLVGKNYPEILGMVVVRAIHSTQEFHEWLNYLTLVAWIVVVRGRHADAFAK